MTGRSSVAELVRLSLKYSLNSESGDALITSVVLTGGELILSPILAEALAKRLKRPLPSAYGPDAA